MKQLLLIIISALIAFPIHSMDKEKQRELVPRSITMPLRLPSDDPEKDLIDFLEVKDEMVKIKAIISQANVARTLTSQTQMLINLDPKLARQSSKDLHQLGCQSSILEGATTFDDAQRELIEIEETQNPKAGSLVEDTTLHERYVKIEEQQLEALCIFISAYERDCPDTFAYILSALNSIMRLEKKRKQLQGSSYSMLPRLLDFKDRLTFITNSENIRKSQRQSVMIPSKTLEQDSNQAREDYQRGQLLLSAAKSYHTKIIDNPRCECSANEFDQVETLYCEVITKFIHAFHHQPNHEEKKQLFTEIQEHLNVVHALKAQRNEKGFGLVNSENFLTICQFVKYHTKQYAIDPAQQGKITWSQAIKETRDTPRALANSEPQQLEAPRKTKLQKILNIIACCKK